MHCCIIGAGKIEQEIPLAGYDYVIAADGGYQYLAACKRIPDLAVGDFDSLGFVPTNCEVIQHPTMKNDTDMLLAVKAALKKNATSIDIYGGLGGRLDHTIANIQTLVYLADKDCSATLIGAQEKVTVLHNSTVTFPASYKGTISVFAIAGKAEGVYETGLLYPLTDATLTPDFPLGVSNEFIGENATIKVKNGYLLLLYGLQ